MEELSLQISHASSCLRVFLSFLDRPFYLTFRYLFPGLLIEHSVVEPNRTPVVRLGLRLSSVIELNRTHPKIIPCANRTQSNVRNSNTATSGFKQGVKKVVYWLQFQTRVGKGANHLFSTYNVPSLTFTRNILLFVLFLLHLMKLCNAKSVACIASVVQQLLQTPLVVLIKI